MAKKECRKESMSWRDARSSSGDMRELVQMQKLEKTEDSREEEQYFSASAILS